MYHAEGIKILEYAPSGDILDNILCNLSSIIENEILVSENYTCYYIIHYYFIQNAIVCSYVPFNN